MPWFESSKEKQFRELVQGKMQICLTKPDKYQQALPVLDSLVRKPNQKAIEMIVNHIKQVIKEDDYPPAQKLRAIILLRDLMESQSKPLGKYVVTKILKRLTILAQHRKAQKDENRGSNIFKCKKSEEKYGIQFLKVLLLCLSDWGKNWPRNADGPFHDFQAAYNDLLLQKQVTFPPEEKRANKSPAPKGFRTSKQQYASPPKMPSNDKKAMIENPLSKPVIKERTPVTGQVAQYLNSMVQLLNLLSTALTENPEFGQMWAIVKAYVDQFKAIDTQGKDISVRMAAKEDSNQDILKLIEDNSAFIADLMKDTGIVDRKNQNYGTYKGKYIKKCKKTVLTIQVFTQKPNSSSLANANNSSARNLKPETSLNQKVEEPPRMLQKPKTQAQRNRYGSSNALRNKLELNLHQVKKEDFNSGTLNKPGEGSEGSNRYNSITVNQNRQSVSQFNTTKEKEKEKQIIETPVQNPFEKKKSQQKGNNDFFEKANETKVEKKQISKITQKNQNSFDFENDVPKNDKSKTHEAFGQFDIEKKQNSNSNSEFFKQLQNKNEGKMQTGRRNRKPPVKAVQEANNMFDISVKSKIDSDGLSGFQKSKSKSGSQQISKDKSKDNQQLKAFDTFKSPNQIGKAVQELRKSQSQLKANKAEDFFGAKNQFQIKADFGQNSFNKSVRSDGNPFQTKFDASFTGPNNGNPFETKFDPDLSRQQRNNEEQDRKSGISNPFSEKRSHSQKSQQKNSIRSKPPIPRKKSELSVNPFDTKSQKDQDDASNMSGISNPFEKPEKKGVQSSKSLSQRGSFVNAKNTATVTANNQSNIMQDFFANPIKQTQKKFPQGISQIRKDSLQEKQQQVKSQGFNFDDFMDVSKRHSQTQSVKNKPGMQPQNELNQSGFNFSQFGDVRNSQPNDKNNSFQSKNFFDQPSKKIEPKPSHESSFDFFQSKAVKAQKDVQKKQSFNFFETSKQQSQKENEGDLKENKKKSLDMMQLDFEDFPNVSNSSAKQSKNPFSQFQKSKGTIDKIKALANESKSGLNKSEESWSKFGKLSAKEGQSDEWNKFNNIAQKQSQQSKDKKDDQSRYEEIQPGQLRKSDGRLGWFNQKSDKRPDPIRNYEQLHHQDRLEDSIKQPRFGNSQKSLSIHFEEPSPFQKKEIPWEYTYGALPSPSRYNVRPQNINEKKEALILIESQNKAMTAQYGQVNQKLNKLKKQYSSCLQKLGAARQQKHEFITILNRLKQSNEIKQRQVEELIKKKIKAEQLKTKILEKERLLYERMKGERRSREQDMAFKEKAGNKWERFNNNLKKQRQSLQIERTVSNFSYYA